MSGVIDEIFDLFARYGTGGYGEDLSLETHMLQAAAKAEALGAPAPIVVAALLHDIGYFLVEGSETSIDEGRNIEHERLGAAYLQAAFDRDVTDPIALHVEAKRYLCAVEPGYFAALSEASRRSLTTQGGIMSAAEAAAFESEPGFAAAVILRRCDDDGKDLVLAVKPIEDYRALLTAHLRLAASDAASRTARLI
jgi:gamma-butyrobetaine dioxygenase